MQRLWLLLWLMCAVPIWAEPIALLSHTGPNHASFLQGSSLQTYEVSPELQHKLARRGLGSRWEYSAPGGSLEFALDRGDDLELRDGLEMLEQFVDRVNQERWKEAHALLPPARQRSIPLADFTQFWSPDAISVNQADWQLIEVKSNRVLVSIHSVEGEIYDEVVSVAPRHIHSQFTLIKQGFRWFLDSYQ